MQEAITIKLTRDQAFALSDWLYQVMFQSDDLEGIVHDRAVWSPIYAISGTLDKTLSEIFMPDYGPRLEAAKERLRADLYGGPDESTAPGQDMTDAPQVHQIVRGTAGHTVKATEGDETRCQVNAQFSNLTRRKCPQLPKLMSLLAPPCRGHRVDVRGGSDEVSIDHVDVAQSRLGLRQGGRRARRGRRHGLVRH